MARYRRGGSLRFSHLARITGLLSGAATHVVARFCQSGHPPRGACADMREPVISAVISYTWGVTELVRL